METEALYQQAEEPATFPFSRPAGVPSGFTFPLKPYFLGLDPQE
jgi:hypothetical protein